MIDLRCGDCLQVMATMPDNSVDAIVTDPPYGLSFMGKKWDYDVPSVNVWRECLRVLKPGGHLLSFAGTRTQHRMAVNIEDAGFEIRDMIAWVYGSGFPKSLDVSKAIDKAAGAEREVVGQGTAGLGKGANGPAHEGGYGAAYNITAPSTEAAKQWEGWGTALKPAMEPITVARKPLIGTVAENVLQHGTGALNIDGCRVGTETTRTIGSAKSNTAAYGDYAGMTPRDNPPERWPANLIHSGEDEVVGLFPVTTSHGGGKATYGGAFGNGKDVTDKDAMQRFKGDTGSAARFFYSAKCSRSDRNEGLDRTCTVKYNVPIGGALCKDVTTVLVELLRRATFGSTLTWHIGECGESIMGRCPSDSLSTTATEISRITESRILSLLTPSLISACIAGASCGTANGGSPVGSAARSSALPATTTPESLAALARGVRDAVSPMLSAISDAANWKPTTNTHSTVKPVALMRYLVRLVTPPDGTVLDPFMGSGSTGKACVVEGFGFIGIERDAEYFEIAKARIGYADNQTEAGAK